MTTRIQALRLALGDDAARKAIIDAVVRADGSREAAATELCLASTTFYRLVAELGIGDQIDAVCEQRGLVKRGARPRGRVPRATLKAIRDGRAKQV